MPSDQFNAIQTQILNYPIEGSLFIEGPARTGKTSACLARLDRILELVPGYQILIITPQQSLAGPYRSHLFEKNPAYGGFPRVTTISGLARDLVNIFWPEIRTTFGFKGESSKPIFLSLETAQYCMARIVDPLLQKGYFQSVKIDSHRLYSQIIDNLNKASIHGLSLDTISSRLVSGALDPSILGNAFTQVQECAKSFRLFCLNNNLVDFSLLMHVAREYLFFEKLPLDYIHARFHALFADNIEEDTPLAHDFYQQRIKSFSSVTLIYDHNGGFRTFLGADSESAYGLKSHCDHTIQLSESLGTDRSIDQFRIGLLSCIDQQQEQPEASIIPPGIVLSIYQFLPEMIDDNVEKIDQLVRSGIPLNSIAVLSPYLSDVLKFAITEKLTIKGIIPQTSRPSRRYLSSSAIRAIFTLAKIAHPSWQLPVSHFEFRECLMRLIKNLDVIRAEQAAKALLGQNESGQFLRSFDTLTNLELQETITFSIGQDLTQLSTWLADYAADGISPLDIFIQRLFGELLSQPQFTLHSDFDAANDIARVIRSISAFRSFSASVFTFDEPALGKAYIESVENGLLPSSFAGINNDENGILISPAHTFLMQNRAVDYQFWLDIGSLGWWERLYQPLTNPYVYQKHWGEGAAWNENREFAINQAMMAKLVNGLLLRCQRGVFAAIVQTNEFGAQNSGPLLKAFQKLARKSRLTEMKEGYVQSA
jgi:hypothetical protein